MDSDSVLSGSRATARQRLGSAARWRNDAPGVRRPGHRGDAASADDTDPVSKGLPARIPVLGALLPGSSVFSGSRSWAGRRRRTLRPGAGPESRRPPPGRSARTLKHTNVTLGLFNVAAAPGAAGLTYVRRRAEACW